MSGLSDSTVQTLPSTTAPPGNGRISMADALFGSTQQRVLALLFGQPQRSFYASELIALVQAGTGAVRRELARLQGAELVSVRQVGKQLHYQANAAAPIFAELCAIVAKTCGVAEPLRGALDPVADQVLAAFVYGSVAKRSDTASSDIDLLLLSDTLDYADLYSRLEATTQALGRDIHPTIYSRSALRERLQRADAFATRVLAQPKLWIIGSEDALRV